MTLQTIPDNTRYGPRLRAALHWVVAAGMLLCTLSGAGIWLVSAKLAVATAATAPGLSAAQEAYDQALVDLLVLEQRLHTAQIQLDDAQEESARIEEQLAAAASAEERAGQDLAIVEKRRSERLREIYMSGDTGWLEVLARSSDFTQLLNRMFLLERFVEQERRLSESIRTARAEAAAAEEALTDARGRQEAAVADLRQVEAELKDARAAQEALAARLGDRLEEARQEAEAARQRMAAINQQAAQSPPPDDQAQDAGGSNGGAAGASVSQAATPTPEPPERDTGSTPVGGRKLTVKSTAYALRGTTATGVPVRYGIVAVDPRVIPLGTRLWIPGYGEGLAADTGGAVKGNKIDVWLPSEREALDWGIKTVTITILD